LKIVIATPSFNSYDAIATDVAEQCRFFQQKGYDCKVFSELGQPTQPIVSYGELKALIAEPSNLLIYHHSIYWKFGYKLLERARCKVVIRYHNITPPEFFEGLDAGATTATIKGTQQTRDIIALGRSANHIYYLGNSTYSCQELVAVGAPSEKTLAIAPFNSLDALAAAQADPEIERMLQDGPPSIAFVGRLVPHKNHLDLLRVVRRYCDVYDSLLRIYFVGSLRSLAPGYARILADQINALALADNVRFTDSVTTQQLKAFYQGSQALVVCSKHEGFCVPIVEAQSQKLPVIAVDTAAIGETVGPDQLLYPTLDLDILSAALRKTIYNNKIKDFLKEAGLKNSKKFHSDVIRTHYSKLDFGGSTAR
jgi:glycosyltransferase involved in cell wall biosynthesis